MKSLQSRLSVTHPHHHTPTPSHTHTVTHPDHRLSVTGEYADEVHAVPSLSHTPTQSLTLIIDYPSQTKMLMKSLQSRLSVTHPYHHTPTHPDQRPSVTGENADEVHAVPSLSHTPTQSPSLIIDHPSQTKMLMKSLQSRLSVTHPHSHSP